MSEKMNIYHAISEILHNGKLTDGIIIIDGFDPKMLIHIKGTYNHNYYNYDNIAILLEVGDDEGGLLYYVCDNNYQILRPLGFRWDDFTSDICELEVEN